MPIYDHLCKNCETVTESIQPIEKKSIKCPACGNRAVRIISCNGVYTSNDDATWLKSVRDVVEKNSGKPHAEEFLKNPTRTNLKNWMDKENLRNLEPGEGEKEPKPWKPDARFTDQLMQKHRERNAITVYR
ncbi:MAG: zinc ribbon domain-containing protein [Proteobacteria bacterium]|nr:zinc ribbon domain-containing protein [Pseudomonadota bacterium]MBU4470296.1 zinc ribbon domain-containing protein [Pseudomonadota bacterium]MCG2752709.1 zinc ribbon domain-containing protein [Desulfobacteraceae bacterium]